MRNLAVVIESFIIGELFTEGAKFVLVQRNELAEQLECAPSQISYAVSTRFTPDRGFLVESKRGSGGFIRIIKVQTTPDKSVRLLTDSSMEACQTIDYLVLKHLITSREGVLMHYSLELLDGHISEKDKRAIVQEAYKRISAPKDKKERM